MIEIAVRHAKPVRIGVNWGSLTRPADADDGREQRPVRRRSANDVMREAVVESGLRPRGARRELGQPRDRDRPPPRSAACRTSSPSTPSSRRAATTRCTGLTEAGMGSKGHRRLHRRHRRAAAAGHRRHHPRLADAGAGRRPHAEVIVAQEILQTMGLRVVHADGGRLPRLRPHHQHVFRELAQRSRAHPPPHARSGARRPGVEEMNVAVMGCVVNGPGESRTPTSASACPAPASARSRRSTRTAKTGPTLKGERIAEEFQEVRPLRRVASRHRPRRVRGADAAAGRRLDAALDAKQLDRAYTFKDFYRTMSLSTPSRTSPTSRITIPTSRSANLPPGALQHPRDRRPVGERLHLRCQGRSHRALRLAPRRRTPLLGSAARAAWRIACCMRRR